MSALQYQDRRFDVLAFRGAKPTGVNELSQTLFGEDNGGEVCAGVQKLAQRWLLEFLTETGSMKFLPERGCGFMTAVRLGQIQTEADLQAEFGFGALEVQRNLQAEEPDDMPDDERYGSVTLDSMAVSDGQVTLSITIDSVAGTSREIILPIPFVPANTEF